MREGICCDMGVLFRAVCALSAIEDRKLGGMLAKELVVRAKGGGKGMMY